MVKSKEFPAVDFRAMVARRDPALAERLAAESIDSEPQLAAAPPPPLSMVTPLAPPSPPHAAAPTPMKETAPRKARKGFVLRADGHEAGRITVYVPPPLALRLRRYCFEHDRTLSDVAGELLVDTLAKILPD